MSIRIGARGLNGLVLRKSGLAMEEAVGRNRDIGCSTLARKGALLQ